MTKHTEIPPHQADKFEVGAILSASWGYDQTNVDFYCITRMTASTVTLVEMTAKTAEDGFMSGHTVPNAIDPKAEPVRRKIHTSTYGQSVRFESYKWAHLWDGKPERCSWYA